MTLTGVISPRIIRLVQETGREKRLARAFFIVRFPARAPTKGGIMAAEIGVPTMRGVQSGIMDYGAGLVAGLVYNTVATFTGSGLIGGAISAGLASAVARGNLATAIAATSGFRTGSVGMRGLGLGNILGGAPRANGNGAPKINLI